MHSSNLRSVSSVKSGTGASKEIKSNRNYVPGDLKNDGCQSTDYRQLDSISIESTSNPGLAGGVPELFNADSMALQPSTFDPRLININAEIDLFRSMMNKTSREAWIILLQLDEKFEYYSYVIQRQFLWELCIDVSVLFKRYGWGKGFVRPLDGGCEDFGSQDRVLFPEAQSTHCVIALPKAGTQAFDFWENKTIEWGIEDEFHFEKLCGVSSCRRDKTLFAESLCREFVSCKINGKIAMLKREDCDLFLKQEAEPEAHSQPPYGGSCRRRSGNRKYVPEQSPGNPNYAPEDHFDQVSSINRSTSVDHSSNLRSVSSDKSGTAASEKSTSNPGIAGGVRELLNADADSTALQPSSPLPPEGGFPFNHFDKSSTFHIININTQIDLFRSMMNKTSRAASILNEEAPEYHPYELHRQFLWELCLDVCPLFQRHGGGKAFVHPLNGGYKGFGPGNRVLFPEARSTHCVIALPKSGRQAFDVRSKKRIEWGREDNFHFENLCAYREDGKISGPGTTFWLAELSPRDILVCQINEEQYLLKLEDCDLFLLQEDCDLLLRPSEEESDLLRHQQMGILLKNRRNEFLQESQERRKRLGTKEENMPSDGWWEHIPEDDETRHWLTGLYMSPPVHSQVVVCKDHPSVEAWMRKEGVFGVVLSVQPESIITLRDDQGNPIIGKDGKEVRMPGMPHVEVTFSEDDRTPPQGGLGGGFYLPADCVKVCEEDEEAEDKEEQDVEDDEMRSNRKYVPGDL